MASRKTTKNEENILHNMNPDEIDNLSDEDLNKIARINTGDIVSKIHALSKKIEESKQESLNAKNMNTKGGFLGIGKGKQRDAKISATSKALVSTNEAVAEMNNLIQETVRLIIISTQLSQVMHKALSKMLAEGFENANGETIRLNKIGKRYVEGLITEIENRMSSEERQTNMIKQYSDEKDEEIEKKQSKRINLLKRHSDKKDKEIEEKQTKRIELLQQHSDEKDTVLEQQQKELIERIATLENYSIIWRIISVIAIVISVASIIVAVS